MASIADALTSGEGVLSIVDLVITVVAGRIGLELDTDAQSALLPDGAQRSHSADLDEEAHIQRLASSNDLERCLRSLKSRLDQLRASLKKPDAGCLNFVLIGVPQALLGPVLYYLDTMSDVALMLNLYGTGNAECEAWANLTASFLAAQYLVAWLGVVLYVKGTHGVVGKYSDGMEMEGFKGAQARPLMEGLKQGRTQPFWFVVFIGPALDLLLLVSCSFITWPSWLFYKGWVWYALVFVPVPLALDVIMFLEPFGWLKLVPSDQLQALVPAYRAARTLGEVTLEGLPQSVLQIHIFERVTSGKSATAGGTLAGVDQTVLVRSLALSLLGFSKAWTEAALSASARGFLQDGCCAGMGAYLQNQLQMGAGMPMNAIEKGEVAEWKSPFRPTRVAQLRILGSALKRPGVKLRKLDLSRCNIGVEGAAVVAKFVGLNRSLVELEYACLLILPYPHQPCRPVMTR